MKLLTAERASQLDTPAPALSRGLAILAALEDESPASLETLAARLQLPKASVLRLLETLQAVGAVRRNPDKAYEAVWCLRPVSDPLALVIEQVLTRMRWLCDETGCTAEWYEPTAEGLVLQQQVHGENEVRVQARPGFLRPWDGEFEAVTRLGCALCTQAPKIGTAEMFVANGVRQRLSRKETQALLREAREGHSASDTAFNLNGVRRFARAVVIEDRLLGVLALAEVFRFDRKDEHHRYPALLAEALNFLPS